MIDIQTNKTGGLLESVSLSLGEYSSKGTEREVGYLSGLPTTILLRSETPDSLGYILERSDTGEDS